MVYLVPQYATRRGGKDDKARRELSLHGWAKERERERESTTERERERDEPGCP